MSTAAIVPNAAPEAPAAGTQEAVNSAGSFDAAAESILDYNPQEAVSAEAPEGFTPPETKPATDATKPAADGTQGATGETKPDATQAAAATDPWAIDQKLLEAALAHPELGPLVKTMQSQLTEAAKWREHWPTVDEAREARALAPGGLEELKGLVTSAREAKAENAEFASGDPVKQAAALQSIAADMPEAFAASAKPYMEVLREKAPEQYQAIGREIATEALKADGVPDTLAALFQAIGAEDEKAFTESLGKLKTWAEEAGFAGKPAASPAPDPKLRAALEENKRLKDAQHEQVLSNFRSWTQSVDSGFEKAVNEEIGKVIDSALPKNLPTAAREALSARLQKEIFAEVDQRLNQDTDLGAKVGQVIGNNAWRDNAEKTREQVHNLRFGRAKQLLPHAAREVLNPFTEAAVAANNAKNEKETQAAGRKDIATGAPTGAARRPALTVKDMKGRGAGTQLSDEAILEL